jgi:hypothetical protein
VAQHRGVRACLACATERAAGVRHRTPRDTGRITGWNIVSTATVTTAGSGSVGRGGKDLRSEMCGMPRDKEAASAIDWSAGRSSTPGGRKPGAISPRPCSIIFAVPCRRTRRNHSALDASTQSPPHSHLNGLLPANATLDGETLVDVRCRTGACSSAIRARRREPGMHDGLLNSKSAPSSDAAWKAARPRSCSNPAKIGTRSAVILRSSRSVDPTSGHRSGICKADGQRQARRADPRITTG